MGIMNLIRYIHQHARKSLLLISLIILMLNVAFVALNYHSSKSALLNTLSKHAHDHENEFRIMLEMTYANMMQMAQFISNDHELNQLFLQGKKAVDANSTSNGGAKAELARQQLLKQVKPAWDKLTAQFNVRQLHYHLGPGSLSFLRVHTPDKYGDRMDDLRHTIVDTYAEETPRIGFETGRIYGGLRAVTPVWTQDPTTAEDIHVGTLEVGTSFDLILPMFASFYGTDISVLLTPEHIETRMWPEFIHKFFSANPAMQYYLESASSPEARQNVPRVLQQISLTPEFTTAHAHLIQLDGKHISVYYFPLRDYEGEQNPHLPAAGFVLTWEDVTPLVTTFRTSVWFNIAYAVIGFILIEIILIWTFNRELRLVTAEREATRDGLTGLYNRRYFDQMLHSELTTSIRSGREVSILVCDIDQFKLYNDHYGHQQGDMCLRRVSACLKRNLGRSIDWVARYGGEEFVVVLPGTDLAGALYVGERLRQAVMELAIPHARSEVASVVTLSLGAASSVETADPKGLFECADKKLYCAKKHGSNRVEG